MISRIIIGGVFGAVGGLFSVATIVLIVCGIIMDNINCKIQNGKPVFEASIMHAYCCYHFTEEEKGKDDYFLYM